MRFLAALLALVLATPAAATEMIELTISATVDGTGIISNGPDPSSWPPECAGAVICEFIGPASRSVSITFAPGVPFSAPGYELSGDFLGDSGFFTLTSTPIYTFAESFQFEIVRLGEGVFEGRNLSYFYASSRGEPVFPFNSFVGTAPTFSVRQVPAGAVPEPATWALLLFGFFAVGGAMRSGAPARSKAVHA